MNLVQRLLPNRLVCDIDNVHDVGTSFAFVNLFIASATVVVVSSQEDRQPLYCLISLRAYLIWRAERARD